MRLQSQLQDIVNVIDSITLLPVVALEQNDAINIMLPLANEDQ